MIEVKKCMMSGNIQYIRTCSIWRALEVIGDKPTLMLMQSYWLGVRRFADFEAQTGLLKTVISHRLQKLIAAECLFKEAYSDRPRRYEYRATQKFLDVYPVALCMLHWEKKWGQKEGKLNVGLIHTECGGIADPCPVCHRCNTGIDARDVSWKEGPGVGQMKASYGRRRATISPRLSTLLFEDSAEIIGDRWSALIIRSLFTGLNRYQDIQHDSAISTNILSERLSRLTDQGIIQKYIVPGRKQARYRLSEKGRDIYPILVALMEWGDKWYPSPQGAPLLLTHNSCGADLRMTMLCSSCHQPVELGDMEFTLDAVDEPGRLISRNRL